MSETWPDIFYERYIHQFQSEPTHKIHLSDMFYRFRNEWILTKLKTSGVRNYTRYTTLKQKIISYGLLWDVYMTVMASK